MAHSVLHASKERFEIALRPPRRRQQAREDLGRKQSAMLGALRYIMHISTERDTAMHWFHLTVIALFVATTILFAVQNVQIVLVSLFGFSGRVPRAPSLS